MECSNSESNITELIKFKDFDLNQIDANHDTVLHHCIYNRNYRTTKIIIDYSEKIGKYNPYERRNMNHKLNFNYIQPNGISYPMYFLLYGTQNIKPKIFTFLLDKANVDVLKSKNKLYGNIFHILIKMKYNIGSVPKDISVQIIRKKLKDESLFSQLFLYDENYNQQTVFMIYLAHHKYERISVLLKEINNFTENPFHINKTDVDGNTAFHYMATILTNEFHDDVIDLYYKYFKQHKEYKSGMKIKNKDGLDFFGIITNSKNNYIVIKFSEFL
jgi:ankyrin repeat protein